MKSNNKMANKIAATQPARNSVLVAVVMTIFALTGGYATTASAESDYDKAAKEMQKGYAEIGKVVNDLDYDKGKSAEKHFNKAMGDFDKAVEHFVIASLPEEDQAAVGQLKKGLDALKKAVKEIEKNNMDKAQEYYDTAHGYFAQAADILD